MSTQFVHELDYSIGDCDNPLLFEEVDGGLGILENLQLEPLWEYV